MSLSKESIAPLLRQFDTWPGFTRTGLRISPLEGASFEQDGGFSIWSWGPPQSSDRGRITYLYADADGTGLFLTIVGSSSAAIKEIEIWRGDGKPAARVPTVEELSIATRGEIS